MSAGYLDFSVEQYATFNISVSLYDTNGNSLNLANYTISSNIANSYITPNVAASFTVQVANSVGGVVELSLDAPTTGSLNPRIRYCYDVISINTTTNSVSRVLTGTIFVLPGITQAF